MRIAVDGVSREPIKEIERGSSTLYNQIEDKKRQRK